jgi:hypothetical protein
MVLSRNGRREIYDRARPTHTREPYDISRFYDSEALEGNGFLPGDTTSGEFKHSKKGMRERRWWVADDCYNICINASVKRAPHLVADSHVDELSEGVTMNESNYDVHENVVAGQPSLIQVLRAGQMKLRSKCKYARYDSTNVSLTLQLYRHILDID